MRLVHTAALLLLLGVGVAAIPVPSSSSKKDGDATNPHANDPWSWYSRGLAGWKAGEKTADLLDGTSWKVPARRKAVRPTLSLLSAPTHRWCCTMPVAEGAMLSDRGGCWARWCSSRPSLASGSSLASQAAKCWTRLKCCVHATLTASGFRRGSEMFPTSPWSTSL